MNSLFSNSIRKRAAIESTTTNFTGCTQHEENSWIKTSEAQEQGFYPLCWSQCVITFLPNLMAVSGFSKRGNRVEKQNRCSDIAAAVSMNMLSVHWVGLAQIELYFCKVRIGIGFAVRAQSGVGIRGSDLMVRCSHLMHPGRGNILWRDVDCRACEMMGLI